MERSNLMSPKTIAAPVFETTLKAKDVMQRPVLAATPRASLRDVASQLVSNEFTGLPIAAADGRIVGVISEADIIRTLLEGKKLENLTASEVMTGPPITVDENATLEEVMKLLEDHRIIRVPVTSEDRLIGIISRSDVIRAILEPEFIAFGAL
jgi:CBS domain-containing protein